MGRLLIFSLLLVLTGVTHAENDNGGSQEKTNRYIVQSNKLASPFYSYSFRQQVQDLKGVTKVTFESGQNRFIIMTEPSFSKDQLIQIINQTGLKSKITESANGAKSES